MIGWRVGWVVAPGDLVNDVCPASTSTTASWRAASPRSARAALAPPEELIAAANAELERRRDETLRQLDGLPAVGAAGGWSLLLDTAALGFDPGVVSDRLLEQKVAATSMRGWGGDVAARHIRFVFSREPVERLALLGDRVRSALP